MKTVKYQSIFLTKEDHYKLYCTHVFLPNDEKLKELSKCRSSLSFNMIYMSPASKKNNFQAFERFDEGIMPQFKVRTFEIASCKSLLLVKKDPWNLVEDFFEPEIQRPVVALLLPTSPSSWPNCAGACFRCQSDRSQL